MGISNFKFQVSNHHIWNSKFKIHQVHFIEASPVLRSHQTGVCFMKSNRNRASHQHSSANPPEFLDAVIEELLTRKLVNTKQIADAWLKRRRMHKMGKRHPVWRWLLLGISTVYQPPLRPQLQQIHSAFCTFYFPFRLQWDLIFVRGACEPLSTRLRLQDYQSVTKALLFY